MKTQLTRGLQRRLMYVENKDGTLDGADARIGWVTFSKTGKTIFYRGKELLKAKGGVTRGNFIDVATGEEHWVSGAKKRGSNGHWAESPLIKIDPDAKDACKELRES